MAAYLKFEVPLKGESKATGFEGQIPLESLQWGLGRGVSVIGGGTSRETSSASFSNVTFSKGTDISSPALFKECCVGKSLKSATITFTNTGGANANQVYMTIKLGEPMITSYGFSSMGDRPGESLSMDFTTIEFFYQGWDGDKQTSNDKKAYNLLTKEAKL